MVTTTRRFQYTDLDGNNNKEWFIDYDGTHATTRWGRVGASHQSKTFQHVSPWWVENKIAEKLGKGYVEIEMNTVQVSKSPTSQPQGNGSRTDKFIESILEEANEYIRTYLAVATSDLSLAQIQRGRQWLQVIAQERSLKMSQRVSRDAEFDALTEYFKAIPTRLPHKIDKYVLADEFKLEEQEDRLNQLEAALGKPTLDDAVPSKQPSLTATLGALIREVDMSSPQYKAVKAYFEGTKARGTLLDIWEVEIPDERKAYDAEQFGAHQISSLWHGTKGQNIRHILKTGFKIPNRYSNGWMFGPGIYLADKALKSQNYASASKMPQSLFLCDAKLGTPYTALDAENYLAAPNGTHSVWGKAGYTRSWGGKLLNNEFICYRASQVTIRYIVTYR